MSSSPYATNVINASGTGLSYNLGSLTMNPSSKEIDVTTGINITIAQATGGWVIQINPATHSVKAQLYIIPEDRDLGVELGKIITMSCLKGNHE